MKFYRIIFIALFSSFCLGLNAQVFIGGSIQFMSSNEKREYNNTIIEKGSEMGFSFSPNVGVFLSENVAIGIELDLMTATGKAGVSNEVTYKESAIGLSPYFRYYAWNWNKFSVFGQGNVGFAFSKSTMELGSTVTKGPKESSFYVRFVPGLSYDLTDKLSLETSINVLGIGFINSVAKDDEFDLKESSSNFYFGAGLDDIFTIGAIKVGAIYKF